MRPDVSMLRAVGLRRGDRAGLLALFYLVGGLLSLVGAASPLNERTPVGLLAVLGAVGLTGAGVLWLGRHRARVVDVHAALVALSLLIAFLVSQSVTAVGVVGVSPAFACLGMYSAHFLTPVAARLHVTFALGASTVGAGLSGVTDVGHGWIVGAVCAVSVTEVQVRLVARLRHTADVDALTGLLNRRAWLNELERLIDSARRRHRPLTVAIIDLDGFKVVNDTEGHRAGDDLLATLAEAWSDCLRPTDLLARYGGDEFALVLPACDAEVAGHVLQRMAHAHPAAWSAGTATWQPGEGAGDLVHRADMALYEHKRLRRAATTAAAHS